MRQWTIDAFTTRPFGGNPACVLEPMRAWPSDAWMQRLAAENNAGATAFLVHGDRAERFALRWFTATVEVPLCGHATLAAAHALFEEMALDAGGVQFDTASGTLSVACVDGALEMNFPAQHAGAVPVPRDLAQALGVIPLELWAGPYLVAILESADAVRGVVPDLERLRSISFRLGGQGNVGVAAAAGDDPRYDVVDRFFAPGYGIAEDAATGSFHCILAPILARRLGRDRLRFHQASPGRGADITCAVAGSRVTLSGTAVTVIESTLRSGPAS